MTQTPMAPTYLPIVAAQRHQFASVCSDARDAFRDVFDLVLIHNEQQVSRNQPRTTLNSAIAMFSVAAWERFVSHVGQITDATHTHPFEGPGLVQSRGAYLGSDKHGTPAVKILNGASAGTIPANWRIRLPHSGSGKRLSFEPACTGLDPRLIEVANWWIGIRNGVAHRTLPAVLNWVYVSNAGDWEGGTINTTLARFALTLFLQLVDQSIRTIADSVGLSDPRDLWLPEDWLSGQLRPTRGIRTPAQLQLWEGASLTVCHD